MSTTTTDATEAIIATSPSGGAYLARYNRPHYNHEHVCVSATERGHRASDGTETWWRAEPYIITAAQLTSLDPKTAKDRKRSEERARTAVGDRASLMGVATPKVGSTIALVRDESRVYVQRGPSTVTTTYRVAVIDKTSTTPSARGVRWYGGGGEILRCVIRVVRNGGLEHAYGDSTSTIVACWSVPKGRADAMALTVAGSIDGEPSIDSVRSALTVLLHG